MARLSEQEVLDILIKVGAFRSGHFVFTSGLHSDSYVLKDALYAYPRETSQICREMAERFKNDNVEAVIGPAIGAAILSQWTAYHLTEMLGHDVYGVYADKDPSTSSRSSPSDEARPSESRTGQADSPQTGRGQGGTGFVIKRGYDKVIAGKRTIIVEDLTTTGGSIKKVVDAARNAGAEIIGAVAIANRGDVTKEAVGNPPRFESLVHLSLEQWPAEECELCASNIPVNTDVGHGKTFESQKHH